MTHISIVTGSYRRFSHLQNMVASVRASIPVGMAYEIVVVGVEGDSDTLAWCDGQPDITLITQDGLHGAVSAFNAGAYAARGKYVLLANDDVLFKDPLSIVRAFVHLENNPSCGGVAFADNRTSTVYGDGTRYQVEYAPAVKDGKRTALPYAQVGMFRKWLGDVCQWWRGTSGFSGRTYGGDNALSCEVWARGYSIDAVPGVIVHDVIVRDELRARNNAYEGTHPDTQSFMDTYPNGAEVGTTHVDALQEQRLPRVLYAPIYEVGHPTQHAQKRGLREALARRFVTAEIDYFEAIARHGMEGFRARLLDFAAAFQPDVLLMQAHGAEQFSPAFLSELRLILPGLVIVNWNGDVWPHGLTAPAVLDMLRHVDLQLVVNASVLPTYAEHGIPAAYWQVAPEPVSDTLPKMPSYDVLFMANGYSERRLELGRRLRELAAKHGFTLGIYGSGWGDVQADGECTYDFATGRALYQSAKIAIGDSQYDNADGFVSNRLFEVLAAGGAILLHQRVPGLKQWTGIDAGNHYVEWADADDLAFKIVYWLDSERDATRRLMAERAQGHIETKHSFDARVTELFGRGGLLATHSRRPMAAPKPLMYMGSLPPPFGVMGRRSGRHYVYGGGLLVVQPEDAPDMVNEGLWVEVD